MHAAMNFDFSFGKPGAKTHSSGQGDSGHSMRILLIGDYGAAAAPPSIAARPLIRVTLDNFADVLSGMDVSIRLPAAVVGGQTDLTLPIRTMEDFHPSALLSSLPGTKPLMNLRRRLQNPATFAAAAAELRAAAGGALPEAPSAPTAAPGGAAGSGGATTAKAEPSDDLFNRLLGRPASAAETSGAAPGGGKAPDLSAFFKAVAAGSSVPAPDAQLPQYMACVEAAIAAHLSAVLHFPAFQRLEANWRALHWLLSNTPDADGLSFHLLHASRGELAADIAQAANPGQSGYFQLLASGAPWSLIAASMIFGPSAEHVSLLATFGAIAANFKCSFVAHGCPMLLSTDNLPVRPDPRQWNPLPAEQEELLQKLRTHPAARHIGLATPRFMARQPYGPKSDPIPEFRYEELPDPAAAHDHFLWANPSFACALLLATGFAEAEGLDFAPGDPNELPDLPAFTYAYQGDKVLKACSEVCLTHDAIDAILGRGIMPLVSFRDQHTVLLARFQSLASPAAPLAGPWRG